MFLMIPNTGSVSELSESVETTHVEILYQLYWGRISSDGDYVSVFR